MAGIDRALVLTLAALILFVLAHSFPFMSFKLEGREQVSTLLTGVVQLYRDGMWPLALLVFCTASLVPLLKLLGYLYVRAAAPPRARPTACARCSLREVVPTWAMTEVYLLGLIVACVKLRDLATIELGIAPIRLRRPDPGHDRGRGRARAARGLGAARPQATRPRAWRGARRGGLARLPRLRPARPRPRLRAGSGHRLPALRRHAPSPQAEQPRRTWALLIAAVILYVPANLLPVMTVTSFGKGEPDTILSGVKALIAAGMWPMALLVFFASITVPVLKMVGLTYLLISVQRGSAWRPRDRTLMYRIIEAVGRWSMVDIFMISILVALVEPRRDRHDRAGRARSRSPRSWSSRCSPRWPSTRG